METQKFMRKPFPVEAVRITAKNMVEVAKWCDGKLEHTKAKSAPAGDNGQRDYIKVRVLRPLNEKQTMGFVGDWVLYSGNGYKVYTNANFLKAFQKFEAIPDLKTIEEIILKAGYEAAVHLPNVMRQHAHSDDAITYVSRTSDLLTNNVIVNEDTHEVSIPAHVRLSDTKPYPY